MDDKQYLRVPEVAKILGISRSKTYELIRQGVIPSVKFGRIIRVPSALLHERMNELVQDGKD